MLDDWIKPEIIVGFFGVLIGALVTWMVSRKQLKRQEKQAREDRKIAELESEAKHRQTVQAFVDYLYDVRSLRKPPAPSGIKLWGVAYKRLHEVRRRLTETLSILPSNHIARDHLIGLLDAFHAWSDEWDKYGEFSDTDTGQRQIMKALQNLQKERINVEEKIRKCFNLPKLSTNDSNASDNDSHNLILEK